MSVLIHATIKGNELSASQGFITSGSLGTVLASFSFDESWNGFTKTVLFYQIEDDWYKKELGTDLTECVVPWETLVYTSPLYVGVYGVIIEDELVEARKTTNFSKVKIDEGTFKESAQGSGPYHMSGTYVHTQSVASTTWVIPHGLNKYPSITVQSTSKITVIGEHNYDSLNQLTLTFSHALAGKAYLN